MQLTLAYRGRSAVTWSPAGVAVALAPNLRRDRVSFEGVLRDPISFREAIGALHDIVVSDLRHPPRDRSAYEAYRAEQSQREAELRRASVKQARAAIEKSLPELPEGYSVGLEARYKQARKTYWKAREKYSRHLMTQDVALWRRLVPCDPVITVANDCVFFECFSADESSYGCLTVDRSAFDRERDVALGTTNVDYSWSLYEHFQQMRSYRETRLLVDPSGFEVRGPAESDGHREEKIDLPPSWLRGFMQIQAAMSLPMLRLRIGREGLYNILAYLKRHRAAKSPRAIRFELEPGRPPLAVLEPWDQRVPLGDAPYDGSNTGVFRTWGRDRLRVLARLLPILDSADVYLLGTGLPSFWTVRSGPIRLTLGLSGWTANDWSRGSALDQFTPPAEGDSPAMNLIAAAFRHEPALSFDRLAAITRISKPMLAVGLSRFALLGQVIHDLPAGLYRWRQIMPVTLSAELIGPEHPETAAARKLAARKGLIVVRRDETLPTGIRIVEGNSLGTQMSLRFDADGRMIHGKCSCSYHHTGGLRRGPCRHLQGLRDVANARLAVRPEWTTLAARYAARWS